MIEPQTVKARASESALGYTANDTEQVAIDFELLEGDDQGKHITWYGFFTDKTIEVTLKSLRTCGFTSDNLADLNLPVDENGIGTNEVTLVIEHEEDLEGNPRARVRWINGGGGVALKTRMDAGAAAAFAERMKGHVLAHKQRTAPSAEQSPNGGRRSERQPPPRNDTAASAARNRSQRAAGAGRAAEQPNDDDIPF